MKSRRKTLTNAALIALVVIAVLALAGVSLAGNGKGKGHGHGQGQGNQGKNDDDQGTSQHHQYSSGGKQYGHHRVLLCHRGHTIRVAPPAVRAHLRHGDKLGAC
jgi:hypothetical protein